MVSGSDAPGTGAESLVKGSYSFMSSRRRQVMRHKRGRVGPAVLAILLVAMLWGILAPVASAEQPAPTPTPDASAGVYTVQAGDTLYSIARKHDVTVDDLLSWNDIPDASRIKVGQKIVIKASAIGAASEEMQSGETSLEIKGRSGSWSTSVRTVVVFGAIFVVLIVLMSVADRLRR
jgi:LysM repeat protein